MLAEALQRLCSSGFIRAVPRVGYIVTSVSLRDFDEIFAVRLVLEPLATELAVPRLSSAALSRLRELASAVLETPTHPPADLGTLFAQLNAAFHREIARIADNRRLERTIAALIDELERVMHMLAYADTLRSVLPEHSQLVDMMESGDAAAAARLMREQLLHDCEVMRDLMAGASRGAGVIASWHEP